jgi:SAM-dependent methyltransferase
MESNNNTSCPLCACLDFQEIQTGFFDCSICRGIFRDRQVLLAPQQEKARYETHNNDVFDPRYRNFVSPITSAVLSDFAPDSGVGLDFGAGTGPVISRVLEENGYAIKQYDPFFHNHPELLEHTYDYIVCCEVIEHFYSPERDFALLKRLLKPGAILYCMTHIFTPDMCFDKWSYIKDPTHVFFYRPETLEWIRKHFGFAALSIDKRAIKLVNS